MKKIIAIICCILAAAAVFTACSKGPGNDEPDIMEDYTLEPSRNQVMIEDGRNYLLADMKDGIVVKTSYAYHYLDPDTAKLIYDAFKTEMKEIDSPLYTDVKLDGLYVILTYTDTHESSLNGFDMSQLELIYGDKIIK